MDRSTQNLKLTALCIYPKNQHIAVGDNKGVVRVFQMNGDSAINIGSWHLAKGGENAREEGIVEIHITQDEQFAIVAFESELICCYDLKNSYNFLGHIEKDAQRFCFTSQL